MFGGYVGFQKVIKGQRYLTRGWIAARYARHVGTIRRWEADPELNFPEPDLTVNDRDYWLEQTLDAWDAHRAERAAMTAADNNRRRSARIHRLKGKKHST